MNLFFGKMQILIKDKAHLHQAATRFLSLTQGRKIFAFYGEMGSGKTTIIKSICHSLGAIDTVTSPTFTIDNEYKTSRGESLYHIDFYRIKKPDEVFDFGAEEYLSSGSYCFMEWPELVEWILPEDTVKVRITVRDDEQRLLDIE
jgi:tRNA threonylcarbamoyladenosine biosynthesis protein TsaE